MTHILYFDGACEWWNGKRNPGGLATYGWWIASENKRVAWGYGEACRGEGATNNVAEYTALIEGVKAAVAVGINDLTIKGDSQLVVYQMIGHYSVKSDTLKPLHKEAKSLISSINPSFEWIPREQNEAADELSKAAYQKSKNLNQPWQERYRSQR